MQMRAATGRGRGQESEVQLEEQALLVGLEREGSISSSLFNFT